MFDLFLGVMFVCQCCAAGNFLMFSCIFQLKVDPFLKISSSQSYRRVRSLMFSPTEEGSNSPLTG